MKNLILFTIALFYGSLLLAQPWCPELGAIFDDKTLPRVDIAISHDTLDWLYANPYSYKEFKAQFVFTKNNTSDTINDVGFRLRGNTSRGSAKKSFKVSFNTFIKGRKYHGLEKMNLNGEHNDPSIIRSYLAWNIFERCHVPGSRSNHVELYINGSYFGLYINVEHIDEEFVESRFGNKLGNLYKCIHPADLSYLGENKDDYKNNGYELKTNKQIDDFSDLINLTSIINNATPNQLASELEPVFNVNGFLRYLAVEVFTGHWDAFTYGRNNFYLFNNYYTGKFEFIPYDLDNTFGIDWFIDDLANRNIYSYWSNDDRRILTSKVLSNQVYKDRFSFILSNLMENYANNDSLFNLIDATFNKIDDAAERDIARTLDYDWSYAEFVASYNEALGKHVKYGLKEYIFLRIKSINEQIELNPIAPIVENVYHNFPKLGESIKVKADITDDGINPIVSFNYNTGNNWESVAMQSTDSRVYAVNIDGIDEPGTVEYYIEATDASGKTTREPYAGEYTIQVGVSNSGLIISEFMASNGNKLFDNYGETNDWIELYNKGNEPESLQGKYLTDDLNDPTKWSLPNVVLNPGEYYIIWADNDTEQGENHANFKLSALGEQIGIFDSFENNYAPIDTLAYDESISNYSLSRLNNGELQLQSFVTPMGSNDDANLSYITITYNMNKLIEEGNFIKNEDFIDVVASFNNYEGSFEIYDGDYDGIHTATFMGLDASSEIKYRARANYIEIEFKNQGSSADRSFDLKAGSNAVRHWFNDDVLGLSDSEIEVNVNIYPNPVKSNDININADQEINKVDIYNSKGVQVWSNSYHSTKTIKIDRNLSSGIYFLKLELMNKSVTKKVIVF